MDLSTKLKQIKLISLTSNKDLVEKVAKNLNIHILDTEIKRFADGEVLFECNEILKNNDIYIIQSTCPPVNEKLMELLICIDALKRAGVKSINAIIPYFGYSRQERKSKFQQPISAKLVADLLTVAGVNHVVCVDLHAPQILGFFNIPVDDISSEDVFYDYFHKIKLKNIVCVSPDHGGITRTMRLAKKLNTSLVIIDKYRVKPNTSEIIAINGNVKNKNCIIVDDIVDTAGTLCQVANQLKQQGALKIFAVITHGLFSNNAINNINKSSLDELIITDTIPLPKEKKSNKIKVLSIASLLSNVIKIMIESN